MIVRVYPLDDNETYIHPKQIVSILAQSAPTITVDWVRGNAIVQSSLDSLIAQQAPEVVIRSHKSMFDHTAVVDISYPEFPGKQVSFVVEPQSCIQLESASPVDDELVKVAAQQIGEVLGYGWKVME